MRILCTSTEKSYVERHLSTSLYFELSYQSANRSKHMMFMIGFVSRDSLEVYGSQPAPIQLLGAFIVGFILS